MAKPPLTSKLPDVDVEAMRAFVAGAPLRANVRGEDPAAAKADGAGGAGNRAAVPKVIRDGFSMPPDDYALIQKTMDRALDHRMVAQKVQVLRAGLRALDRMDDAELIRLLADVEPVKSGRGS